MPTPAISVVIPTLGRPRVLVDTVASLLRQTCSHQEIIIVDQSDNRAPLDTGPLADPRVRYFRVDFRGSPAARNYAIVRARAPVVFSGDDDIIASPQLLQAHLDCYLDPTVGGVAGRVLTREDKPLRASARVGAVDWFTGRMTGNFHATERQRVWHVQGSNCSFRRSVLEHVGGFDAAFTGIGHFEEADLSFRVVRAGWRLVFEPRAKARHLQSGRGGNRPRNFRERTFWHFHNYGVLFRRHFPRQALPWFATFQALRALGYAVREHDPGIFPTALAALLRGLTHPVHQSTLRRPLTAQPAWPTADQEHRS